MEFDDTVYAYTLNAIFCKRCTEAIPILEMFGSPREIFELSEHELRDIFGRNASIIEAILDRSRLLESSKEVEWARKCGIDIIYFRDSAYPHKLKECPDAPIIIFKKGHAELNSVRSISIVGTRKATEYGIEECRKIVRFLAGLDPQPVIVSGLAYGIDICAHRTAMECGMQTFGIMATGPDCIYPARHRDEAVKMTRQGCLLTDFPKGTPPMPFNFIRRNRIIAGLSDATIVVESDLRGGSITTAHLAASYYREVLAVPGRTTDRYSSGCNALIYKNTATALCSPEDVCNVLGWDIPHVAKGNSRLEELFNTTDIVKRNILTTLAANLSADINLIVEKTGEDTTKVLASLTELELEDIVEADIFGNYYLKGYDRHSHPSI